MRDFKPIVPPVEPVVPPDGEMARQAEAEVLSNTLRSGANWFFWIAGLSVVNSVITLMSEGGGGFVVGLGITQVIDGIAYGLTHSAEGVEGAESFEVIEGNAATVVLGIAFALSVFVSLVFVGLGWVAKRRHGWAFIIGMSFYAMDGLVLLLFSDIFGLGFHVFALYCIFMGYRALRNLRAMETLVVAEAG